MQFETPARLQCECASGGALHYGRVFRFAPDAMLILDPIAERIRDANRRACSLLGYARGDLVRIAPRTLHAHEIDTFMGFLTQAQEGGAPLSMRLHCRHASGRLMAVQASATRLDREAGRAPVLLIVLREPGPEVALHNVSVFGRDAPTDEGSGRSTEIIGGGAAINTAIAAIERVAPTDATVLITGETGTGKELVAEAIHGHSARRGRALIRVNCAALPSELVESELFGHERGAFTGAIAQRAGRFEIADGGTLFLDEVGELSLAAQAKLLRVLQSYTFERVGGTRSLRVDVRIVAATNRAIAELVDTGAFREDLYYRLGVFPIRLPPLRERKSDIAELVRHFAAIVEAKMGKSFRIPTCELDALQVHEWPGNVRELQSVVERAAILSDDGRLDLRAALQAEPARRAHTRGNADRHTRSENLETAVRNHIREVLERRHWLVEGPRGAASALGMHPSTLRSRIRKLGIERCR